MRLIVIIQGVFHFVKINKFFLKKRGFIAPYKIKGVCKMKRNLIFVLLMFIAVNLFSQDLSEWENCTEGLWGNNHYDLLFINDNDLYTKIQPYSYSSDGGKTWIKQKVKDSTTGETIYIEQYSANKIDSTYIIFGMNSCWISNDQKNWRKIQYQLPDIKTKSSIVNLANSLKIISINNHLVTRCSWTVKDKSDTTKYIQYYRTCIGTIKDIDNQRVLVFDTIPEFNDYQITTGENRFVYYKYGNILYAIHFKSGSSISYTRYIYFSEDGGFHWEKKEIPEIQGGIKSVSQINGKIWILSPFAIWRPKENGSYEKLEDAKFDNFNTDFLIEHKGMIYAQAIDSSTHKYVIVRSTDNGATWHQKGSLNHRLTQLFSIREELVGCSWIYSIIASTDDGETWEERNNGLYDSPDYLYEGPWKKIVKLNENEYLTVPRNNMLRNTVMKSYDGGKSWNRKIVIPQVGQPDEYKWANDNYNFTLNQNKYGLFAVDRGSGKTYKSYDKGESWEFYSDVSAFYLDEDKNMYERNDTLFYFYNSSYFATYKYIYYSLDTGHTWIMYDSLFIQKLPEKSNFLFVKDGNYYSINYKSFTLFKSIDHGKIWNFERQISKMTSDTLNYQSIYSYVENKDTILILANLSTNSNSINQQTYLSPIYITKDFGRTFIQTNFPKINGKNIAEDNKFLYLNGKLILLLLGFQNSESNLFEFDEEKNEWINIAQNLDGNIITDILSVDNYLYISTIEGLFRMRVDPVSVKEEIERVTLLPIELYPNPASGIVKLQNNYYNLTNLQIYDIYGREQQLSNFSNEQFDVSRLQAGVYIVKLTFDNSWFITRKFVKM